MYGKLGNYIFYKKDFAVDLFLCILRLYGVAPSIVIFNSYDAVFLSRLPNLHTIDICASIFLVDELQSQFGVGENLTLGP